MGLYMVISCFLGFCGLVDSVHQPRRAWQNAGKSKGFWVIINLLGMVSIVGGAVTFVVYSYGGTRKAVVRGGGVNTAAPVQYARSNIALLRFLLQQGSATESQLKREGFSDIDIRTVLRNSHVTTAAQGSYMLTREGQNALG